MSRRSTVNPPKPEPPYWSCDRWGRADGPDSDDPVCTCSMCTVRRYDRARPGKAKKKR